MELIQIDIVMNTRQRIKGHWIKKSILATLLMGLFYLFATIDIGQVGQGIERWGENIGRAADEAGGNIGDAARAAAESDAAHALGRGADKVTQFMKEASGRPQQAPPRPANQLARRPVTNTLPPSPGLAPAAARAGAPPTGNLDDLSIKLQGTANDVMDMQAKQASPANIPQPGSPPQRTAMDDDFDKSMAQARQQYCYETGDGVAKDLDKAAEWYNKAANLGNGEAKYLLNKLKEQQR